MDKESGDLQEHHCSSIDKIVEGCRLPVRKSKSTDDGDDVWEMAEILAMKKGEDGRRSFQVHFLEFNSYQNEWVEEDRLKLGKVFFPKETLVPRPSTPDICNPVPVPLTFSWASVPKQSKQSLKVRHDGTGASNSSEPIMSIDQETSVAEDFNGNSKGMDDKSETTATPSSSGSEMREEPPPAPRGSDYKGLDESMEEDPDRLKLGRASFPKNATVARHLSPDICAPLRPDVSAAPASKSKKRKSKKQQDGAPNSSLLISIKLEESVSEDLNGNDDDDLFDKFSTPPSAGVHPHPPAPSGTTPSPEIDAVDIEHHLASLIKSPQHVSVVTCRPKSSCQQRTQQQLSPDITELPGLRQTSRTSNPVKAEESNLKVSIPLTSLSILQPRPQPQQEKSETKKLSSINVGRIHPPMLHRFLKIDVKKGKTANVELKTPALSSSEKFRADIPCPVPVVPVSPRNPLNFATGNESVPKSEVDLKLELEQKNGTRQEDMKEDKPATASPTDPDPEELTRNPDITASNDRSRGITERSGKGSKSTSPRSTRSDKSSSGSEGSTRRITTRSKTALHLQKNSDLESRPRSKYVETSSDESVPEYSPTPIPTKAKAKAGRRKGSTSRGQPRPRSGKGSGSGSRTPDKTAQVETEEKPTRVAHVDIAADINQRLKTMKLSRRKATATTATKSFRPPYSPEEKERLYGDRAFVMLASDIENKPEDMCLWQIMKTDGYLLQFYPAKFGGRQFHVSTCTRWYFFPEDFTSEAFYNHFQPICVDVAKEKVVFPETKNYKAMVDRSIYFPYTDKSTFNRMMKQMGKIHLSEYLRRDFIQMNHFMSYLVIYPDLMTHLPDETLDPLVASWKKIDQVIRNVIEKACETTFLNQETLRNIQLFPDMKYSPKNWNVKKDEKKICYCSACPNQRLPMVEVTFHSTTAPGAERPYNPVTYREWPENHELAVKPPKKSFYWCRECSVAGRKLNRLMHYMYRLFRSVRNCMANTLEILQRNAGGNKIADSMLIWAQSLEMNWMIDQFIELRICLAEVEYDVVQTPIP